MNNLRFEFAEPLWLLLLPLLVLVAWLKNRYEKKHQPPALLFPGVERLIASGFAAPRWMLLLPQWLRWSALLCGVLALAEPQLSVRQSEAEVKGIDMVLALDISESMLQRDASGTSRFDAAREVARKVVLRRTNDRLGLVVFRGKAYTQCPLTLDHRVLALLLDHLSPHLIRDNGTAIGSALLVAINRFKASESPYKAIVLITDGENNAGEVSAATAAELARQQGIRIYVVNTQLAVMQTAFQFENEESGYSEQGDVLLQEVARLSGGGYFKVQDKAAFEQTLRTIDRQEKSYHSQHLVVHRQKLLLPLLLVMLVLFLLDVGLSSTRLLRIP